jgi:hypothetical protein
MTQIRALSLTFGVEVILSYSDLSDDDVTVSIVSDETIEITLNGFSYHISVTDFTEFVLDQVSLMRSIGC